MTKCDLCRYGSMGFCFHPTNSDTVWCNSVNNKCQDRALFKLSWVTVFLFGGPLMSVPVIIFAIFTRDLVVLMAWSVSFLGTVGYLIISDIRRTIRADRNRRIALDVEARREQGEWRV